MRTLLSRFCDDFETIFRPLLTPLKGATQTLSDAAAGIPGTGILPSLLDLHHRLDLLVRKVVHQQAYLLIFGPLKSGKSTLMNALSAAYVSEVTSLPAYPCMVYVSHADRTEFVLTRFNGKTENLADPAALRMAINRAHVELAAKLRLIESTGAAFDPSIHFPEAIRRVDVRMPAGMLSQSEAVLVDTPGLYTRMKIGYGNMTREFRDTAACGIFVVKSDNLFLDQVFEEFNELLEHFSRIFLVVNMDSSKQDLRPDGSLAPSLEGSEPTRIVEAFENLSMNAPLKKAVDEGRLCIYPVDLLRAASLRIRQQQPDAESADALAAPTSEENAGIRLRFETFLEDLTEYLNSNDYIITFLEDCLRQAETIAAELVNACAHDEIRELRERAEPLAEERDAIRSEQQALTRLEAFDWDEAVAQLCGHLAARVEARSEELSEEASRSLRETVSRWFQSEASLSALIDDDLQPILRRYQEHLSEYLQAELEQMVGQGTAAFDLPGDLRESRERVGLDLDRLGRAGLENLDRTSGAENINLSVSTDAIPIRRTFWDWILFRSSATVRRRVFGPAEGPTFPIPPAVKGRRLGEPAQEAINGALRTFTGRFFPETVERIKSRDPGIYVKRVLEAIRQDLNRLKSGLTRRLEEVSAELDAYWKVLTALKRLETALDGIPDPLQGMQDRYRQVSGEDLEEGKLDETLPADAGEEDPPEDGTSKDDPIALVDDEGRLFPSVEEASAGPDDAGVAQALPAAGHDNESAARDDDPSASDDEDPAEEDTDSRAAGEGARSLKQEVDDLVGSASDEIDEFLEGGQDKSSTAAQVKTSGNGTGPGAEHEFPISRRAES